MHTLHTYMTNMQSVSYPPAYARGGVRVSHGIHKYIGADLHTFGVRVTLHTYKRPGDSYLHTYDT